MQITLAIVHLKSRPGLSQVVKCSANIFLGCQELKESILEILNFEQISTSMGNLQLGTRIFTWEQMGRAADQIVILVSVSAMVGLSELDRIVR